MKVALLLPAILLVVAAYDAVAQDSPDTSDGLNIQASFYPYYEFTRAVASENDTVVQFLPAGVAAHDWEPSISRVQSLVESDVFVYNGLGFEGYLERLTESDDLAHVTFVKATNGLALISTVPIDDTALAILEEYENGMRDETQTADAIASSLNGEEARAVLEGYRDGTATILETIHLIDAIYSGGYEYTVLPEVRAILQSIQDGDITYAQGLEEMHGMLSTPEDDGHGHGHSHGHSHGEEDAGDDGHDHGIVDPHVWLDPVLAIQQVYNIRDGLASANPAGAEVYRANAESFAAQLEELHRDYSGGLSDCAQDTIVTTHQAFGYLVERYGIKVETLSGIAPEAISAVDVVDLVEFMRDNDIGYVLAEDIVDTRVVNVLAEETGAQVLTLSPLESATASQLESGVTYMDRMRENLTILETALSCG
ncbi:MAG: zinc ABC transporter substrate-binding protein [Thaumarchaeota archaeon]|nr:zinc ABC transporter substrate-binding protein [Nitrososphaerota archaeon]